MLLESPVVSTYYTTINTFDAQTWQNITYNLKGATAPNFETVIRTNANVSIYDLRQKWATAQPGNKPVMQVLQLVFMFCFIVLNAFS